MDNLRIFEKEEFGSIRTIIINEEPYFVGKDVAIALGYSDENKAISMHVDDEDKLNDKSSPSFGQRGTWVINESGLYSLIMSSKLPSAKSFKKWVTSEVLPSIRKNGGYIANQERMTPEQIVANALIVANNIICNQNRQIEEMKPKADFFDAVTDSTDAIDMASAAKVLNMGIGRNRLFELLRQHKYLDYKNRPMQKYIDKGYFRVVESKYGKPNGDICINLKTIVYQKGLEAIRQLLNNL